MAILLGIGLAILLNSKSVAGDVQFDVIQTRTDVYEDVTVTGHNETDIFLIHSKGMANVKIQDLDPETLWRVGLGDKPLEPGSAEAVAAAEAAVSKNTMPAALTKLLESASLPAMESDMQQQVMAMASASQIPIDQINPTHLIIALSIVLALYLFFSYCLKLIVQKTGTEPGLMVWLPFFQVFPMLRAAGMSGWWVLAMFIPLVNIIVHIVWCVKIVQARGKGVMTTIFLILPLTDLLAFLYLAFSNGEKSAEEDAEAGKLVVQSAFAEA